MIEKKSLGRTGIFVSPICLGSLTMTPFQSNLTIAEGAHLIRSAGERGINFIDTAELYENYEYIAAGIKGVPRDQWVLATKTYAYDRLGAEKSLGRALQELGTDYIDLFLLHEQESIHTLRGHMQAIEYLLQQKEAGTIRAVGISTHRVEGARGFRQIPELDVIHPILNVDGIGIQGGNLEDMLRELEAIKAQNRGIYAMKILGGGHLIPEVERAFAFVRGLRILDAVAVGMQSLEELEANIALWRHGVLPEELRLALGKKKRRLIVADYCIGCGNCERACRSGGIRLVEGRATPTENCILCGYCARYCPEFCIKVI